MLHLGHVFFEWVENLECCKYREKVTVIQLQQVCMVMWILAPVF